MNISNMTGLLEIPKRVNAFLKQFVGQCETLTEYIKGTGQTPTIDAYNGAIATFEKENKGFSLKMTPDGNCELHLAKGDNRDSKVRFLGIDVHHFTPYTDKQGNPVPKVVDGETKRGATPYVELLMDGVVGKTKIWLHSESGKPDSREIDLASLGAAVMAAGQAIMDEANKAITPDAE